MFFLFFFHFFEAFASQLSSLGAIAFDGRRSPRPCDVGPGADAARGVGVVTERLGIQKEKNVFHFVFFIFFHILFITFWYIFSISLS